MWLTASGPFWHPHDSCVRWLPPLLGATGTDAASSASSQHPSYPGLNDTLKYEWLIIKFNLFYETLNFYFIYLTFHFLTFIRLVYLHVYEILLNRTLDAYFSKQNFATCINILTILTQSIISKSFPWNSFMTVQHQYSLVSTLIFLNTR